MKFEKQKESWYMTPRERVRRVLNHQEADRIFIESNSTVSAIHEVAYDKLLDYLGIEDNDRPLVCPTQRIRQASDEILDLFGVDTRVVYAKPGSNYVYEEKPDGSWVDEFGTVLKRCGLYCDISEPVLKNASLEDAKRYKFPNPRDPGRFDGLREKAREMYDKTDYALIAGNQFAIYYIAWVLRGIRQFTEDSILNKELSFYLMDKIVDWDIEFLDGYIDAIGDFVEWFWVVDDWGVQSGPFISPKMFKEEMFPRFKKIIDFIKSKTDTKICFHTCGSTYWAIPDFIEMGADILHPMQPNAAGNDDPEKLKREFGPKMVFHGNTNNQGVFHRSKEEVAADALYRIRYLAPEGGYIFSSGHNIQADMPPENIMAFFNTAKEYGVYPIDTDKIDNKIRELAELKPEIRNQIKLP
jgi:uroporphyrinogen decarboxylase